MLPSSNSRQHLIKLAGDISTRRYYRVQTESQSYIVQQAEAFHSENENFFILAQKIFSFCGVRVPRILETRAELGLILMEDLGDHMLQESPEATLYTRAVDFLTGWTHRGHAHLVPVPLQSAPHFRQFFDTEKLCFEMRHTDTHLFEKLLRQTPGSFLQHTEFNTEFLNQRPRFLCHRDYHSRNIMVHKGELVVIDFQDARMGPITYDLVSLLCDPYAQPAPTFQQSLKSLWEQATFVRTSDPKVNRLLELAHDNLDEEWHRMKIQRLLKASGSYASFFNTRGRNDYLPCIDYAVRESCHSLEWLCERGFGRSADELLLSYLKSHNFTQLGDS